MLETSTKHIYYYFTIGAFPVHLGTGFLSLFLSPLSLLSLVSRNNWRGMKCQYCHLHQSSSAATKWQCKFPLSFVSSQEKIFILNMAPFSSLPVSPIFCCSNAKVQKEKVRCCPQRTLISRKITYLCYFHIHLLGVKIWSFVVSAAGSITQINPPDKIIKGRLYQVP